MSHLGSPSFRLLILGTLFWSKIVWSNNADMTEPTILSPTDTQRLRHALDTACQQQMTAGAVAVIVAGSEVVFCHAAGYACLQPHVIPMTLDTHFDLASLTKPMVTTTLIMQLVEQQIIALDDTISQHLPEFAGNGKEAITVRHCLTHTAGLPAFRRWFREGLEGKSAYWQAICQLELDALPGSTRKYSDFGPMILGILLEKLTNQPLEDLAHKQIFQPLGMDCTGYQPPLPPWSDQQAWAQIESQQGFVCTEYDHRGVMKCGIVHDENTSAMGGIAGHAGVFSTAADLATFARFMLGTLPRPLQTTVLAPTTIEYMLTPHWTDSSPQQGLGWWLNPKPEDELGWLPSTHVFGHTGFTGPTWWMDSERKLAVLLLANVVHPHRNQAQRKELRALFFSEVARVFYPETHETPSQKQSYPQN